MKCKTCKEKMLMVQHITRGVGVYEQTTQKTYYCLKCGSLHMGSCLSENINLSGDTKSIESFVEDNLLYVVYNNAAGLKLCKKEEKGVWKYED